MKLHPFCLDHYNLYKMAKYMVTVFTGFQNPVISQTQGLFSDFFLIEQTFNGFRVYRFTLGHDKLVFPIYSTLQSLPLKSVIFHNNNFCQKWPIL